MAWLSSVLIGALTKGSQMDIHFPQPHSSQPALFPEPGQGPPRKPHTTALPAEFQINPSLWGWWFQQRAEETPQISWWKQSRVEPQGVAKLQALIVSIGSVTPNSGPRPPIMDLLSQAASDPPGESFCHFTGFS